MFVHNIDPVLLSLGPFNITYYGLVYALGVLAVYFTLRAFNKELNIEKDDADNITIWIAIGLILGARLFEVFIWNPSYYLSNPIEILAIWKGGMSFHGGLVGTIIAATIMGKKYNMGFAKLADILVLPLIFILALGRIANFINGELVGIITNVPWCVDFGDKLCRHPVVLYGAAGRAFLGVFLVYLYKKSYKPGMVFWIFALLISAGRFGIDLLREDAIIGQILSLIIFTIAAYVLIKYYKPISS